MVAPKKTDDGFAPLTQAEEIEKGFLDLVSDPTQVSDPRMVQMAIMQRILGAEDFDAALDQAEVGALSTEDVADVPFTIDGLSWHKSSEAFRENSVGVFALLEITVLDGPLKDQQVALTTGSHNVLATLKKGVDAGAIPDPDADTRRLFRFKGNRTSSGQTAYWLARA